MRVILLTMLLSLVVGMGSIIATDFMTVAPVIEEPASDLGWLAALCSSLTDDDLTAEAPAEDDAMLRDASVYSADLIVEGEINYGLFCANCHGANGEGEAAFGPPLVQNVFTRGMNDEALARFIVNGRSADDPFSITGRAMPPRGGFPNLDEDAIMSIVAYIRSIDS
jgi:mono/diheme cytochrome c family protein